jgi:hypothetical protein
MDFQKNSHREIKDADLHPAFNELDSLAVVKFIVDGSGKSALARM